MAVSGRHADRPQLSWTRAATGVAGLLVVIGFFASVATVLVARLVVTPPRGRSERTRVTAMDLAGGQITLARSPDTELPGRYGLWTSLDTGHLKLGRIVDETARSVTREIIDVDFGDPGAARRGRFSGWFTLLPDELGFPWQEVEIATPLGPAPAWLVPAPGVTGKWVILVHGRGVKRSEGLRSVPVFRRAGFTSLLVSWRNDGDAPASPDGRYGLGGTEWVDVEAAVAFAVESGATEVVLMGWSMGGAIVLQVAARSRFRSLIRGIVLESPVVDWAPTLDFQARQMRVPAVIRRGVLSTLRGGMSRWLTGLAAPLDFAALNFVGRSAELDLPMLVMHSADDGYVPDTASVALAEARPDLVTFHRWTGARHAKLWNYDTPRFEAQISSWLTNLR